MKTYLRIIAASYLMIYAPILLLSVFIPFYRWQFRINSVYANFLKDGYSKEFVNEQSKNLIQYMHGVSSELDSAFFTEVDQLHMNDVRSLFLLFDSVLILTLIIVLVGFRWHKIRNKDLVRSSLLVGIIILIILVIVFTNFDAGFILLHRILFSNDYWLLDPDSSNLIRFFPQQFFINFSILSLLSSATILLSIFLIARQKLHKDKKLATGKY